MTTTTVAVILFFLIVFVQACYSKIVFVDGLAGWKNPTVHVGDSLKSNRTLQLLPVDFLNDDTANSDSFTWHPSRAGYFYFFYNNGMSAGARQQGKKLAVRALQKPPEEEISPSLSPSSSEASPPSEGGVFRSSPALKWRKLVPPASAPVASPAAAPVARPDSGFGVPFITSNPAVPLPTGETDEATIRPLPTSDAVVPHPQIEKMELELGLKIRRARDNLSSDIQISKKYGGPLFTSTETEIMFILVGHLPGFKKDEIKIEINDSGSEIAVSGQTYIREMAMVRWRLQMKEPNNRYFRKVFRIPESVILDEIKAWFDDEETSLTIFLPKSIKEIQGILIEEVKEEQVGREKVASTEKTEADGAQTSELNEGIRPEFGQKNEVSECENLETNHRALSRKDSAADNSEGETSESTRLIQTGKAGSQENMENSDGETPELNDKVKPYKVGEKETNHEERSEMNEGLHPEVNQEKETGHDETSEMTGLHFEVDQGKETSHDERSVTNDRLHPESDRENERNEGEISERNPRVQPELLQIAEQDQETLNSVKKESDQLEEKDDKEARHDMQTPDTTEMTECPPEVEDRQKEEPEEGSIKENPAVEVPKAAYGTQEKLPMLEEEQMDGAAPSLLTRDQNKEDEEQSARAADSSEIGRTPDNLDILTPVMGGREKKGKRYDGRPSTVIAGSAFLVSLIVLSVHLHRSKKQN